MKQVYSNPLKVYLILGILAVVGIYCGTQLPISLFPNTSKPIVVVRIPYGNMTAQEFAKSYGNEMEHYLKGLSTEDVKVEQIKAYYEQDEASYEVEFEWGNNPRVALNDARNVVNAFASRLPKESLEHIGIYSNRENAGFFAASFYSETRSLDDLYELLEPIIVPRISKLSETEDPVLWNPSEKEIRIELKPEAMASLQLLPRDIERALAPMLSSYRGRPPQFLQSNQ